MTDPDCTECGGEGIVYESDRYSSDGVRKAPCDKCSIDDEDRTYDEMRDREIDMEESKRDAYD